MLEKENKEKNKIYKKNTENNFDILRIEAGAIEGVNIPFILVLPQNSSQNMKNKLTVVFNNEGGKKLAESVNNMESSIPGIVELFGLETPAIIPILPSKEEFDETLKMEKIDLEVGDSKQFARECFDEKIKKGSKFYRLDEQVKNMLQNLVSNESFRTQIQEKRGRNDALEFEDKMVGFGHSGAGAAMLRFLMIHPEMFDTAIIGGNGDIIPTPFGKNGKELEYPFGVKDYLKLFGREFLEKAFKDINFQFYIGDKEDKEDRFDTIREDNYKEGNRGSEFAPKDLADKYKEKYGIRFFERFANVLEYYEQTGARVGVKIYKDDCHGPIRKEDFHRLLYEEKIFDGDCSKQVRKMLDERKKLTFRKITEDMISNNKVKMDEVDKRMQAIEAGVKLQEQMKTGQIQGDE